MPRHSGSGIPVDKVCTEQKKAREAAKRWRGHRRIKKIQWDRIKKAQKDREGEKMEEKKQFQSILVSQKTICFHQISVTGNSEPRIKSRGLYAEKNFGPSSTGNLLKKC